MRLRTINTPKKIHPYLQTIINVLHGHDTWPPAGSHMYMHTSHTCVDIHTASCGVPYSKDLPHLHFALTLRQGCFLGTPPLTPHTLCAPVKQNGTFVRTSSFVSSGSRRCRLRIKAVYARRHVPVCKCIRASVVLLKLRFHPLDPRSNWWPWPTNTALKAT